MTERDEYEDEEFVKIPMVEWDPLNVPTDAKIQAEVRRVVRELVEATPEPRDGLENMATVALGVAGGALVLGAVSSPIGRFLGSKAPWFEIDQLGLILIALAVAGAAFAVRYWRRRN